MFVYIQAHLTDDQEFFETVEIEMNENGDIRDLLDDLGEAGWNIMWFRTATYFPKAPSEPATETASA